MVLHLDFETYSSVDLATSGMYKYMESPDFEILLAAYSVDGDPVQILDFTESPLLSFTALSNLIGRAEEIHAHNAAFERNALNTYGLIEPVEKFHCSMIKSAYCGLTLSLGEVSKALDLGDSSKDKAGKDLIKLFCQPVKPVKSNNFRTRNQPSDYPEKWEAFKEYCKQDVVAEMAIVEKLSCYEIPITERLNYFLDQKINDKGVRIDLNLAKSAINIDEQNTDVLKAEMIELTGVDNPNSPAQLKNWLTLKTGIDVTTLAKEIIPDLIKATDDPKVKQVLELRQKLAKSSVKKYTSMINCACEDKRARGLFQFYGANRTGRYSGRLIQLQNLPQNHLNDLDTAIKIIKMNDFDLASISYENISSILSQLIRTALLPSPGNILNVADFSAIEARVIAWLAGEEWRLKVFRGHGKIYEASASMMFNVAIETITKDSPLRQKGKIAELALGYQGSIGALEKMGGEKMGLSEEEMRKIVKVWRAANPNIVQLWGDVEGAAIAAIKSKKDIKLKCLVFGCDGKVLTIQLPSGRKLFYQSPQFTINKFGKQSIKYKGMDQEKKTWGWVDSYGGKFVENCLTFNTKVLTLSGWKKLGLMAKSDLVWDGEEWQKHEGLIYKGVQEVINVDGVELTPDHKILTKNGWKEASQVEGLNRYKVKLPDSFRVRRIGRKKIKMESTVRLWEYKNNGRFRVQKRQSQIVRMHAEKINRQGQHDTRAFKTPDLCDLEVNASQMQQSKAQSISQLRGKRYKSMRSLGGLRNFCSGYASNISNRFRDRQNRQRWELFKRKLSLDNSEKEYEKQENKYYNRYDRRAYDNGRSCGDLRYKCNNYMLSSSKQLSSFEVIRQTRRKEQVYDLLNCGERHRFTILSNKGPIIVHNCVQAISRDLLTDSMLRLDAKGFNIILHVHDEVAADEKTDRLKEMCSIMSEPVSWAPGLPLNAEGFISNYYKK